jgi:hypothetical protein
LGGEVEGAKTGVGLEVVAEVARGLGGIVDGFQKASFEKTLGGLVEVGIRRGRVG